LAYSRSGATPQNGIILACKTPDNSKLLVAFIARKAEIDTTPARLTVMSSKHFNRAPHDASSGDAETLGGYLKRLREVSDAAFHKDAL
jgi:hypothetical protein